MPKTETKETKTKAKKATEKATKKETKQEAKQEIIYAENLTKEDLRIARANYEATEGQIALESAYCKMDKELDLQLLPGKFELECGYVLSPEQERYFSPPYTFEYGNDDDDDCPYDYIDFYTHNLILKQTNIGPKFYIAKVAKVCDDYGNASTFSRETKEIGKDEFYQVLGDTIMHCSFFVKDRTVESSVHEKHLVEAHKLVRVEEAGYQLTKFHKDNGMRPLVPNVYSGHKYYKMNPTKSSIAIEGLCDDYPGPGICKMGSPFSDRLRFLKDDTNPFEDIFM